MKIAVIGAGFGGLSVAALLAKAGHHVDVYEKNDQPGGRAYVFKGDGFTFDAGPSWYLMPDVYEEFFGYFDKKPEDYYRLTKLDPSYEVYFGHKTFTARQIEAGLAEFIKAEPASAERLQRHLAATKDEYDRVRNSLLQIDGLSIKNFVRPDVISFLAHPKRLGSFHRRVKKVVSDPDLQKVLEFMVVFLGGSPKNIPAFYGLLNWVDFGMGVYYPQGGFGAVARAFETLAKEQGVQIFYNAEVKHISNVGDTVKAIKTDKFEKEYDIVVANADPHFVDQQLVAPEMRQMSEKRWAKQTMSPSAVIGFIGTKKQLPLPHHSMFFDTEWDENFDTVYRTHTVHKKPLFYLCTPSKTDSTVAPNGSENMFILIPVSSKVSVSESQAQTMVDDAIDRIARQTSMPIKELVTYKKILTPDYFGTQFHSYANSAFGPAHTFMQSGPFRMSIRSKKLKNLYFVGQGTNPGTGVPLVVLSGALVAERIAKDWSKHGRANI